MTPLARDEPTWRRPLLAAWFGLSLGALALTAQLVQFWGTRLESVDRFLILIAAICIARSLRNSAPGSRPQLRPAFPLVLLASGLLPFAAYLSTQAAGGRSLLLWLAATVLAVGAIGLLLAEGGWRRARHYAFPILFAFFALPIPSRVLGPLQNRLQEATTTLSAAVFSWMGMHVERSGFTLRLPAGELGVAEACSGVQSLTALMALAALVAYRKGFGPVRGTVLTLLALPVVVIVNALRVIASGLIQEQAGSEYIRGDWHAALGFAMLFAGLAAIARIAQGLHCKHNLAPIEFQSRPIPPARRVTHALNGCIIAGVLAGAGAYYLGASRQGALAQDAPLEALPLQFDGWRGEDRPVPDEVSSILGQDRILHRVYENNLGQKVFVWVIYWSSPKLVKGYHHPDVCWANKGFRVLAKRREVLQPKDCGVISATGREFVRGERETQFILYWTQEGNRVWTDADETLAQADLGLFSRPEWLDDALTLKQAQPTGRLVVLVGTESTAPLAQAECLRFARELAGAVYALVPWARPVDGGL